MGTVTENPPRARLRGRGRERAHDEAQWQGSHRPPQLRSGRRAPQPTSYPRNMLCNFLGEPQLPAPRLRRSRHATRLGPPSPHRDPSDPSRAPSRPRMPRPAHRAATGEDGPASCRRGANDPQGPIVTRPRRACCMAGRNLDSRPRMPRPADRAEALGARPTGRVPRLSRFARCRRPGERCAAVAKRLSRIGYTPGR